MLLRLISGGDNCASCDPDEFIYQLLIVCVMYMTIEHISQRISSRCCAILAFITKYRIVGEDYPPFLNP